MQNEGQGFFAKENAHQVARMRRVELWDNSKGVQVEPDPAADGIGLADDEMLNPRRNNRHAAAAKRNKASLHDRIAATFIAIPNLQTVMEMEHTCTLVLGIPVIGPHAQDWKINRKFHRTENCPGG